MNKCKFTIITVCLNAQEAVEKTIRSVLMQTFKDFEYIIKDGKSADETMKTVHNLTYNDNRVIIIQDMDKGIYDAMNTAVQQASGDYILFLNAGDRFADSNVLSEISDVILKNGNTDILYGNIIEIRKENSNLRTYTAKNSKLRYYALGACLCHQAMFCKRELFKKKVFDLNYRVCADREWQMYHLKNGATAKPVNITVAEVLVEGFSKEHVGELEQETDVCVKKYCGKWYYLYRMIVRLKRNKRLYSFIQKVEERISCK